MGRLLADAGTGKRQVEYRDVFRYFKPKELKEEELDRVLDILAGKSGTDIRWGRRAG